ncbi:MAG: phenylalanine--tRNA ligase subunit beta [Thermodesulfobacteriota bacterium]|nr:phenylalanine--tRNA ligase subunit beta [Thermodesulfobacteriota bacterium]
MKASLNWLKKYIDLHLSPDELGDALTMAGLEVECIIKTEKNLNNIVVGKISSIKNHPNADKLSLCQVTTGECLYSIVCGAKNMKAGDRVALAIEGALLANGMEIKKTKIRGELSEGMLCSEQELGIGEDSNGIMILEDDLDLNKDIASALNLNDHIFELNITPNRPDCLSIIGIAREIAAITGKALKIPKIEFKEGDERTEDLTSIELQDTELCPRYSARLISDLVIGPAPFWMRRMLESVGIRPICNIVDITNFVLMEFGQPLHAFDFDLLSERRVVVKRADYNEVFVSLDGVKRTLSNDTLMICDGEKPIAIAGIMGGLNSEVRENSSTILIESAYFHPTNIRKTSKKMGLQTESSFRFERGVDPEGVIRASNRATQLIVDLCGGNALKGIIDRYPSPILNKEIPLGIKKMNNILGTSLKKETIKGYLNSIELDVRDLDGERINVGIPSFRTDLNREIDLVEEVARLDGYDNIPTTTPMARVASSKIGSAQVLEKNIKDIFSLMGFYEVVNYSFISPAWIAILNVSPDHYYNKYIHIKNPLREDQSIMRTTLIPGILKTMQTNIFNNNLNLKLFEVGTVFYLKREEKLPREKKMLSGLATGLRYGESWNVPGDEIDFFDLKGSVENLFKGLNIRDYNFLAAFDIPYLHPGKSSIITIENSNIGLLGEVRSEVLEDFGLSKTAYIFEIDFDLLVKYALSDKGIRPLSKYPPIIRDIALIIDDNVQSKDIYDAMIGLNNSLIKDIQVFDVYKGEPIPFGKKSIAYRIKYQSYERTLTDNEVNALHERLISVLVDKVGARIRE